MANLSSIARPYALAAFEYACDKQCLAQWKAFLGSAAEMASQSVITKLLANPEVSAQKTFELFHEVLSSIMDAEQTNFLHLLAQNKRLVVLHDIASLFNAYVAQLEKISTVKLVTAVQVDKTFEHKFAQALSKRTQREIKLNCEVDPKIIGGAIIHIGDKVIDGSVRGKLSRLLQDLTG